MQDSPQKPAFPGAIIANGKRVPCAVKVETWQTHGLTFPSQVKRKRTDLIVVHWTAGEGDGERVHKTLRDRGLSVHFVIESDGTVVQYMDTSVLGAHAADMNARSVGIEIVNRATDEADKMPKRPLVREKIRGRDTVYTAFLPAQVRSCLALVMALCEAYGLPIEVPRVAPGGDVLPRELTWAELEAFRGVVGHFHWSKKGKRDPGLMVLRAVAALPGRLAQGIGCPL